MTALPEGLTGAGGEPGPRASTASSTEAGLPADAVEVGRIAAAWGVKGWVRVHPYAADPAALLASKQWYLQPSADRADAVGPGPREVVQARRHGGGVVAAIRGVADRDAAERLCGAQVFVARASFPAPEADEYYWVDLIGLAVRNRDGVDLGEVVGLIDTGVHCVLRVQLLAAAGAEAPPERLIPFVGAYVDRVDRAGRRILVDWGLDY